MWRLLLNYLVISIMRGRGLAALLSGRDAAKVFFGGHIYFNLIGADTETGETPPTLFMEKIPFADLINTR